MPLRTQATAPRAPRPSRRSEGAHKPLSPTAYDRAAAHRACLLCFARRGWLRCMAGPDSLSAGDGCH